METESAAENVENTDQVQAVKTQSVSKDDTRSKVNTTVATTQEKNTSSKEAKTADSEKPTVGSELQDDSSISSSDDDNESSKGNGTKLLLIHSTEEGTNTNANIPITINNNATQDVVTEGTESQSVAILGSNVEHKMLTTTDKTPETMKSNTKRQRSTSSLPNNSHRGDKGSSDQRPRMRRANTVSFKIEATTPVKEALLEIDPQIVVVSSCSTNPNSELKEDSEDMAITNPKASTNQNSELKEDSKDVVIANPKASTNPNSELKEDSEDAVNADPEVYNTLTRKRAVSGIDAVMVKSANKARSSVKINTNVEMTVLDDVTGDENLSPVSRVSTFGRYRKTFSWNRGRSFARQSFAGKSKDNFLSFHNIGYTVPQKKFFRATGTKVILKNVSGIMHSGINAIMGPSGSGKTTLLDIISGRKVARGVTGNVVINGEFIPENFRCASGYVTQEETVTGTLTVKENIMFSAQLRLPRDMTYDEKIEIVEEVISDLNLENCAHSRVGTEKQRGVSGGERKRTAIGMELIVSPGVLFLDEPTSGLDSTTAISVMKILHNLSLQGRVIILSIHQPRYSILKLFDTMTLLSRGEMIYHGPVRPALPFFTDVLGVEHEKYNNPADFFIDVIIRNENHMYGINASEEDVIEMKEVEAGSTVNEYADSYMKSEEYKSLQQELSPILDKARRNPVGWAPNYANNLFWQVWHLSIRTFKTIVRDLNGAFTTIMAIILLAIFSGVIFFQLDTTLQGQRDRVGAMFFNMLCNILPGLAGMEALVTERALFIHENANGFYNTGAYFLAKIMMDIIPFRILTVFLYCPIAYFITGLRSGADRFFFYMLTMLVLSFAAASQVFTFSAVIGVYKVANPLLLMVIAVSMVFSGFFITLGNIRVWLRWLQYLSIYRYAFHAFMWNEFDDTVFCNKDTSLLPANASEVVEAFNCQQSISANLNCDLNFTLCGDVLLGHYQFDAFNVWWNIVILIAAAILTLIIGFVGLLCASKRK